MSRYLALVNTMAGCVTQLRQTRGSTRKLDQAQDYIKEMAFCGCFNPLLRKETAQPLQQLLAEMQSELAASPLVP